MSEVYKAMKHKIEANRKQNEAMGGKKEKKKEKMRRSMFMATLSDRMKSGKK